MPASIRHKHGKLEPISYGNWGRRELAIHGLTCSEFREFTHKLAQELNGEWSLAIMDASHEEDTSGDSIPRFSGLSSPAGLGLNLPGAPHKIRQHHVFDEADLVLLNGNHFTAATQIIFVNERKPLHKKLERLSQVILVVTEADHPGIPDFLKEVVAADTPMLAESDQEGFSLFFRQYLSSQVAPVKGLVLAGGKSQRMGQDKRLLEYHGMPQQQYLVKLLKPYCKEVLVSCNAVQAEKIEEPHIVDRLVDIGPMAGILTAFMNDPNAAWLCVACDLPFLSEKTIEFLIANRDPSCMATVFLDAESQLPEPLITIWEPRAYPLLLLALSEGQSCPRKVLMSGKMNYQKAPESRELQNINDPEAYKLAKTELSQARYKPL